MHFLLHTLLHFPLHMSMSFLKWQALLHTQHPIPQLIIRPLLIPRQMSCPSSQIRFHLLPIKVRVIPSHDPPLHEKRRGSGDEGRRKGRSCDRLISASALRSHDPDARRCEIRLLGMVDPGVPAAGKRSIDPGPAVVGADSERTERRGRDCERRLRRRFEKSRILPECGG